MIIHFPHLGLNLKIAAVNQIPTKFSSIHYRTPTPSPSSRKAAEGKKKTNKPSLLKRKKELRIIVSIRENLARCSASGALKYLPISCCIASSCFLYPTIFSPIKDPDVCAAPTKGARLNAWRGYERSSFHGSSSGEIIGRNLLAEIVEKGERERDNLIKLNRETHSRSGQEIPNEDVH